MKHSVRAISTPTSTDEKERDLCQKLNEIAQRCVGDCKLFKSEASKENKNWEPLVGGLFLRAFRDGPNAFAFTDRDRDLSVIAEAQMLLDQYERKISALSVAPWFALRKLEERDIPTAPTARMPDPQRALHRVLEGNIGRAKRNLSKVARLVAIKGASKRVDWRAAGVAAECSQFWERKTGKRVPKSVHADAPGPYGRFLTEVIDAIWLVYAPRETPPSARSAMRALENITNSGVTFRSMW